jgi:hypothetical protein
MQYPPQQERSVMKIVTFLRGVFRVITNDPTQEELDAVYKSRLTRRPEKMSNHIEVQDVETGEWIYSLLEHKLNQRGIPFRLGMIKNSDLMEGVRVGSWTVGNLIHGSNFAWANASYSFFLRIDGDENFGLESLGLQAIDAKKTSKRLQELTRLTQLYDHGFIGNLDYYMFTDDDLPCEEIVYDGGIFVRESFMLAACNNINDDTVRRYHRKMIKSRKIGPMIARFLTDNGEVKGLLHVMADEHLVADIVFHQSALKKELKTVDGTWHFTAFRHKMLHKGMWDMQTAVNNHNWLTTEERFEQDLATILPEVKAALDSGELPKWMLYQEEEAHNDDQMVSHDHVTSYWIDAAKRLSHVELQKNNIPVTASANIIQMAYGSIRNQMRSALENKRMWVPMSQSFVADVITKESILHMTMLPEDGFMDNKLFFHEEFGVVFPGDRFAKTADLHDTWDQDGDNALFVRIKLWSSDEAVTQERKNDHIIPMEMILPLDPEQAIDACVVIRRPNSPGGYSIELCDMDSMPFMRTEVDPQVIDLAITPPSLSALLKKVQAGTLQSTVQYSGEAMERFDAENMIVAQMSNPGVGSFANAIMVHASIYGASFPKKLVAQGNDVIDAVQQESDKRLFQKIKVGVDEMWTNLAAMPATIDSYILATRVPAQFQDPTNNVWTVAEGSWTRMYKSYLAALDEIEEEVRKGSFTIREQSNFVAMVKNEIPTLSDNIQTWAAQFFAKYNKMLSQSDKMFRVSPNADRFVKANAAADRSEHVSGIVEQMVADLKATAYPEKYALALYRWIIDPEMTNTKYGASDRIIFQGGKPGQETVLDLFIEGVLTLD